MNDNPTSTSPTTATSTPTHFAVPAGREWLLDDPAHCPAFGALTFDGVVADAADQLHLVLRTTSTRAHLGPDRDVVARRALILATALHDGTARLPPNRAAAVVQWVMECWDALQDEIQAAALTRSQTAPCARPALRLVRATDQGPTVDDAGP